VFVRSSESTAATEGTRPAAMTPFEGPPLLPPGTRMVARLESAATTALKTPVVASVEYNYERDEVIVVPAGTKVFGDLQQASSEGYLNVQFHTLRMPNGREEKIEATAVSLDHKPLKGEVSGKNTGKKLLSRTLSGVGTVAAYVVGSGGAGLTWTITGETLLRDRVASNVALAGEQELANAAYSQKHQRDIARQHAVLCRASETSGCHHFHHNCRASPSVRRNAHGTGTPRTYGFEARDQPHVSGIEHHFAWRTETLERKFQATNRAVRDVIFHMRQERRAVCLCQSSFRMSYVRHCRRWVPKKAFATRLCTSDFFTSSGVIWYVTEGSPDDEDFVFFGFVVGPDEEWGEFSLSELTDCARSGVPIERDVHFKPERISLVMSRKG
jgi:Protein of unknown function (DUF2958)